MTKILLIDDHSIVRKGVLGVLEKSFPGSDFFEASTVEESLNFLNRDRFDIVICDISLPDGSGLEILEKFSSTMKFIMLSMHDDSIYSNRALNLGAVAYVCKGEDPQKLIDLVRSLIRKIPMLKFNTKETSTELPHQQLSQRETLVFLDLIKGKTSKEISKEKELAASTVGTYKKRILQKLSLGNERELIEYAIRNGLL